MCVSQNGFIEYRNDTCILILTFRGNSCWIKRSGAMSWVRTWNLGLWMGENIILGRMRVGA